MMEKKDLFNTFVRQKIALSLLLGVKNCYQMAKEWGQLDQQILFRKNCKFLKDNKLLNEDSRKTVKGKPHIKYILVYENFAEQILHKMMKRCDEKKIVHEVPEFTKEDLKNFADFSRTDLFKFFVEKKFYDSKNKKWLINGRYKLMLTEPFVEFARLLLFKDRSEAKKIDYWSTLFKTVYPMEFTVAELNSLKISTGPGILAYKYMKILQKVIPSPKKEESAVHMSASVEHNLKYPQAIYLPPYNWWR